MTKVLHLVDSIDYVRSNCFQHQLHRTLQSTGFVDTVGLDDLRDPSGYDRMVCCLKQRTLRSRVKHVASLLGAIPVIVYDQDPWCAYMDDSPYKGTYELVASELNVVSFAVTTREWSRRIVNDGLPSMFVRMWVLPEYCDVGPKFEDRSIPVGFIGSLHPHRKLLFDRLDDMGTSVNVMAGSSLSYPRYLQALSNLRVFVHSEDVPILVDGEATNLKDALWIKDVEAAARGCFTVRNSGVDSDSYYDGIETTFLYDDVSQVPSILERIASLDPCERVDMVDRSVRFIKSSDRWQETAHQLLGVKQPHGREVR